MRAWLRRYAPLLGLLALGLAYRLFLMTRYYGWEESDYGNLAMTRGVLESSFTVFDMRHLPVYYGTSAAVMGIVGDAIIATRIVTVTCGLLCIALAWRLAERLFDRQVATLAGLLLVFEPEFALYSSTSLREPLYTAAWLGGLWLALGGRPARAALSMSIAFLTRFDALFTGVPTLLWHFATRPGPARRRAAQMGAVLLVSALFAGAWSVYCGIVHGDYVFIRQTVQVNVATGGAQEVTSPWEFMRHGLEIDWALLTSILPRKLGVAMWALALAGLGVVARRAWRSPDLRTFVLAGVLNTGFWLAVGFFAQHEPNHNLYWKWMYVLVPFWAILAAATAAGLLRRVRPAVGVGLGLALAAITAQAFAAETRDQLAMSERLYRPQVEVARFIEDAVPPGTAMILDNIPACYINRRENGYELWSWFDVQVERGDRASMASFIEGHDIRYILWFKEDWTLAPGIAPYLAVVAEHDVGPYHLVPLASEDEYGFIFYRVDRAP